MDLYNASTVLEEEEPMVLSLEEYEETKKALQTVIDRADAAKRIASNPDFKALVMEGYLTDEPQRLAELMSSGRLTKSSMENCAAEMDAVGKFRSFFRLMITQGDEARNELASLEIARDEALAAEAEAQG